MEPTTTRLNKYLSEAGYCSRRAADKLIDEGRVTINGIVPEMGTKVLDGDEVKVDGKTILNEDKKRTYIAFNKPVCNGSGSEPKSYDLPLPEFGACW